jgi:acetyltransferase-like isoleucine patch superfamily enzyme
MTDVFISYRKSTGREYARNIQQALENRGCGNVFFDYDSLREGKFNEKIIDAINESKNFVLVLSKGALDRCVEEGDWVTKEIETAIKAGTNIVPVFIDNEFEGFPNNLPESISEIQFKQAITLHTDDGFKDSINRILLRFKIVNKKRKQYKWDVFLTCSSSIIEFAERLRNELIQFEIHPCFDRELLADNIGCLYKDVIHNGICQSQKFLFLYTSDINNSSFIIQEEVAYARKIGKDIICVIPNTDVCSKMPVELYTLLDGAQWIVVGEDGREEVYSKIREIIPSENKKPWIDHIHLIRNSIFTDVLLSSIVSEISLLFGTSTNGILVKLFQADNSAYKWKNVKMKILPKSFFFQIPLQKKEKLKYLHFIENKKTRNAEEIISSVFNYCKEEYDIHNRLVSFISNNYELSDIYDWLRSHIPSYVKTFSEFDFSISSLFDICGNYVADNIISDINNTKTMFNADMTGVYNITETKIGEGKELTFFLYYTDYFTYKCMTTLYHILRSLKDCFSINENNIVDYSPFLASIGLGGLVVCNQGDESFLMFSKRASPFSSGAIWHLSYDETVSVSKDCVRDEGSMIRIENDNCLTIDPFCIYKRGLYEELGLYINNDDISCGIVSVGLIKGERIEIEILSYYDYFIDIDKEIQIEQLKALNSDFNNVVEYLPIRKLYRLNEVLATPESKYLSTLLNNMYNSYTGSRHDVERGNYVDIGINVNIGQNSSIGDLCKIGNGCNIGSRCELHRNVLIEDEVVIGHRVIIDNNNSVLYGIEIDNDVYIGQNVSFCTEKDSWKTVNNNEGTKEEHKHCLKIFVHKGAFIGSGAIIKGGITIGEYAVVEPGSIVVSDVPDGAIVAGNPARIIKTKN